MNPTVALPGYMTWMGIRLSSGSRCPQSRKGLPLHLLNRRVAILNFAFFAKFRVGMLEADPNQRPAMRDAGDRVGINNTKTRKSARRLCPGKELPHSSQNQP